MTRQPTQGKRVAVIGSGLAGLTTAYLLLQRGVTVYLIEKSDKLGFHSSSIDIDSSLQSEAERKKERNGDGVRTEVSGKKGWTIDVPMRSFQGGYYPNLIALYRHLGIPMVATHYTFSFARLVPTTITTTTTTSRKRVVPPHFIHSGASGHSIPSLPSTAYSSPIAFITSCLTLVGYAGCYILLLALSFLSYHALLPTLFSGTLRDFTTQISNFLYHPIPLIPLYTPLGILWRNFVATLVIPLFSSVGTMPEEEVYGTQVGVLLDYIHKTVGTDHYSPGPGHSARTIAERLSEPVSGQGEGNLRLGSEVKGLRREGGEIVVELGDSEIRVDRVVLATPASVAGKLLGMLESSVEGREGERLGMMRDALKRVRYKETIVITHRDSSILPNTPDIRDLNLIHPSSSSSSSSSFDSTKSGSFSKSNLGGTPHFQPEEGYTMATHVIRPPISSSRSHSNSSLQIDRGEIYQSTNPCLPINSDLVLGIARLERALPLPNPSLTLPSLNPGKGLVYIVGSYAYPGIPLLEGCVGSSKRVISTLEDDLRLSPSSLSSPPDLSSLSLGMGGVRSKEENGKKEGEVDWSKGRGGFIGRVWRWRSGDGL